MYLMGTATSSLLAMKPLKPPKRESGFHLNPIIITTFQLSYPRETKKLAGWCHIARQIQKEKQWLRNYRQFQTYPLIFLVIINTLFCLLIWSVEKNVKIKHQLKVIPCRRVVCYSIFLLSSSLLETAQPSLNDSKDNTNESDFTSDYSIVISLLYR